MSIIPTNSVILGYSYVENKYCDGNIATYSTLAKAESACNADAKCGSITDTSCDDTDWKTCKGSILVTSSVGSCSWVKPGKFWAVRYLNKEEYR